MKITFDELEKMGYESVTDYCRYLVDNWDVYCSFSKKDKIEVYRGEMLCLTVSSIEEGAKIEPTSRGWQKHTGRRSSKGRGCV